MGCGRHHLLWGAVLVLLSGEHARFCLGARDHLAALLVARGGPAGLFAPWSLAPEPLAGAARWRWGQSAVVLVPRHGRRRARGMGRCGRLSGGVDELDDAVEPLIVEVVRRTVA